MGPRHLGLTHRQYQGHIEVKQRGAVVFISAEDGRYQQVSYWWQHTAEATTRATPGSGSIVGRWGTEGASAGLVMATLRLAADGGVRGELEFVDTDRIAPFVYSLI